MKRYFSLILVPSSSSAKTSLPVITLGIPAAPMQVKAKKLYLSVNELKAILYFIAPINVEILKFPSLSETLQKSWKTIPSRHVELSPIYIRFCSLIRFRDIHGRNPTVSDEKGFFHIVTQLMERNEVDLISAVAPTIPALLVSVEGGMILNSSILGSFLSQEVIKAVSLQGTPGVNVFVYNGKDNSVKCIPII